MKLIAFVLRAVVYAMLALAWVTAVAAATLAIATARFFRHERPE